MMTSRLATEKFYATVGLAAIVFAIALTIGAGWLLSMSGLFPLSDKVWPFCTSVQCVGYDGPDTAVGFFAWGIAVWIVMAIAVVVVRIGYVISWSVGEELVEWFAAVRHNADGAQ